MFGSPRREYFFKTTEEFEKMIEKDELIEYAKYVNNYYGTPKKYVFDNLSEGKNIILEIEIQGALNIKERFPDAVLIFITPPSASELKNRLVGRGTEDEATINARLQRAFEEAPTAKKYDYIVVNDSISHCVEDINNIIESEKKATFRNKELVDKINEELKIFRKE